MRIADLSRVILNGADLSRADLRGADLNGANLSWAEYNNGTKWPADFDPKEAGAIKAEEWLLHHP